MLADEAGQVQVRRGKLDADFLPRLAAAAVGAGPVELYDAVWDQAIKTKAAALIETAPAAKSHKKYARAWGRVTPDPKLERRRPPPRWAAPF